MKTVFSIKKILYIGLPIIIVIVLTFIFRKTFFHENKILKVVPVKDSVHIPIVIYGIVVDSFNITENTVKNNENLSTILSGYKISPLDISIIADSAKSVFDVRKIIPGNKYLILTPKDSSKKAKYFVYEINIIDFIVCKLDNPITVYRDHKKCDTILKSMSAEIDTSLWVDMMSRGGTPDLIVTLSDVFAWQIDFYGIYQQDKVKVIYEELQVEGKAVGMGKIWAAWFEHSGEEFYAFYYKRDKIDEYFDQKGNCLRRAFLKSPLRFSRISSGFSRSRFHPILRIFRPHTGIDYVAPRGTPVHTIGDGTVISAGWSGGAGNMVVIRHNESYQTAYNHLSAYGKGIRNGKRVRQGDIIGYVGSTGLSTGPHLDFRMWKNGAPINPLRIKSPTVKALENDKMPDFNKVKDKWMVELNKIKVE